MTFVIAANNTAFGNLDAVGLACALSVILLIITVIVTVVQKVLFKDKR